MRAEHAFAAAGGHNNNSSGLATGWVAFWSQYVDTNPNHGSSSSSGGGGGGSDEAASNLRDPAARRLAELASAATRAMRRWNMYQRLCRPLKALTDGSRV
jgi:hypothetical protein